MSDGRASSSDPERFDRQMRFAGLGASGQASLERASVLLVGCGALGGVVAQTLARAGVGRLVLVDRDVVERSNLPRQVLFDEEHARLGEPKALAAASSLAAFGGPTRVEPHARHLDASALDELGAGVDLVVDGTDNLRTRYLVNDWCVRAGRPWIYGGVVGGSGLVLPVIPGHGPCLRCVFPEPPPAGSLPTCDTAGVVLPAVGAIASLQAGLALRLLASAPDGLPTAQLVELDAWNGSARTIVAPPDPDCPCCARREFAFLDDVDDAAESLCGRDTAQIRGGDARPDLGQLAARLEGRVDALERRGPFLRFRADGARVTVFADGRALLEGVPDLDRARSLYDRWIGA